VLRALVDAGGGQAIAYGADPWTERATARLREDFGADAEVLFALTGTGANVVSLAVLLRPHEAVLCAASAHLNTDESAAPERFIGCKLVPVETEHGKLTPDDVSSALGGQGVDYLAQIGAVSISQSTELGTVYTPAEVRALADVAHRHGLRLHLDGARLANAAASLGVSLGEITTGAGVDALTVGGTKNGLLYGEAVVVAPEHAGAAAFVRKQAGQTASKLRFVSAQFEALFAEELWLRSARHANEMAKRLADRVDGAPGLRVLHPVESNAVFASVPPDRLPELHELRPFYDWSDGVVRWMTSFATEPDDVDEFAAGIRQVLGGCRPASSAA
jgi:threonine aldolase